MFYFALYFNSWWFVDLGIDFKVHIRTVWGLARFGGMTGARKWTFFSIPGLDHYNCFLTLTIILHFHCFYREIKKLLANKNVNSSVIFDFSTGPLKEPSAATYYFQGGWRCILPCTYFHHMVLITWIKRSNDMTVIKWHLWCHWLCHFQVHCPFKEIDSFGI